MKKRRVSGFTLIEVLIVVVIIGVLAALIVPRLTSVPEKAKLAEAYQLLGALIRAQVTYKDLNSTATFLSIRLDNTASNDDPGQTANLASLGMQHPALNLKFRYECSGNSCFATPFVGSGSSTPVYGYLRLTENQTWECAMGTTNGYVYQQTGGADDNTKPCVRG